MSREVEVTNPDSWGSGLRFGLKTLNTKRVKRAKAPETVLLVCLRHNLRKDNEGHRHRSLINASRTRLNEVLVGPSNPSAGAELAQNILDELGLPPPPRIDTIMGVELVFQPPDGWDERSFYDGCLAWVRGRYEHVLSAVVHRDQKRPHMHVLALPITEQRRTGAEMTSGANRLQAQRSDFMASMREAFGLRPDRRTGATPGTKPKKVKSPRPAAGSLADPPEHAQATAINLIAREPHSPTDGDQPHSPVDLMAATPHGHDLILRKLHALSAMFENARPFGTPQGAPVVPLNPAPMPPDHGQCQVPDGLLDGSRHVRLERLNEPAASAATAAQFAVDRCVADASTVASELCVGVHEYLDEAEPSLQGDGPADPVAPATPWRSTVKASAAAAHGARTCRHCTNRLRAGTCGAPVAAGLTSAFEVVWAPNGFASTCKAFVDVAARSHLAANSAAEAEVECAT